MADNGAIEQLPVRTLSHVVGHDGSGRVGREPVTDFVKSTRQVVVGTGLTGGGYLSADVIIGLSSDSVASLALAGSALQPGTGVNRIPLFANAAGATIPTGVDRIYIDDRGGNFKKVSSEPAHNLKFQNGSQWWSIDEGVVTSKMAGAAIDGSADDLTPLTNLFNYAQIGSGAIRVKTGAYALSANLAPAFSSTKVLIDGAVTFPGTGILSLENLIPFQVAPVFSQDSETKDYTSAEASLYANQYLFARHARIAFTGAAAVAVFGQGEAAASGARAFGGNFLGQVSVNGGTAIGVEVDCGIRGSATSGNAYGVLVAAAGNAQPRNALQIQAHSASSAFQDGMVFAFNSVSGSGAVTGALWKATGVSASTGSCARFLYVDSGISATTAEIDIPSLIVAATPISVANRLQISGAVSGNGPRLTATGSDTNISLSLASQGTGVIQFNTNGAEAFRVASGGGVDNIQVSAGTGSCILNVRGGSADASLNLQGKGAGNTNLRSSSGASVVSVNTTGLGFFAATPVAKQTITGSKGSNAALTSLLAALATVGLVADSTT